MEIKPARVAQVRRANTGQFIEISEDVGGVAEDLKRIDAGLRVRFAENGNPPYWHVVHVSDREQYLVLTAEAHQNKSGTWEGLDHRIVERCRYIGSGSYDFVAELEKQSWEARQAEYDRLAKFSEDHADEAMAAIRKDLGRNTATANVSRVV